MDRTKISVIIVAHDRKDFLKQAVSSVLNQSLSRDFFEVHVIKNFSDSSIDSFLQENGVLSHLTKNVPVGSKYALGITASANEVVCFLEDDDQFSQNKLEFIQSKFSNEPDLGYIRHGFIPIGKDGTVLTDNKLDIHSDMGFESPYYDEKLGDMFKNKTGDLSSCICIRKSILVDSLTMLSNISSVADKFFLISSLSDTYKISSINNKLTLYRIHESMSNTFLSPENSLMKEKDYLKNSVEDYSVMTRLTNAQTIGKFLQNIINNNQVITFLLEGGVDRLVPLEKSVDRLRYLKKKFLTKNNFILTLFSIIYVFSPFAASRYYTKIRKGFHARRIRHSNNKV